ncbi:M15 family metallopeptidase [Elongatibacter sediminis]|uniref:M15 family metallopeptidase n=1 Tax=Elongatibacter sediminis TaxID=3119006 RepID=A0AAW9R9J7_9GAMM
MATSNPSSNARQSFVSPASPDDLPWLKDWYRHHTPITQARLEPAGGEKAELRFRRSIEDGCVVIANGFRGVQGVAALDLDSGEVWALAVARRRPDTRHIQPLMDAIERLAVAFCFDHITIEPVPDRSELLTGLGYRAPTRSASGRPALRRALSRRWTRYGRRIRAIGAELGIPSNYARRHRLRLQAESPRLESIGTDVFGREQRLTPPAATAWRAMVETAARAGTALQAVSAFRSVDYQAALLRRKLEHGQKMEQILRVSAAPGFSEHHTGNALDITTPGAEPLEESFEHTRAFAWLCQHAPAHGFRLSFPRENRHRLAYEPWHWCYRG